MARRGASFSAVPSTAQFSNCSLDWSRRRASGRFEQFLAVLMDEQGGLSLRRDYQESCVRGRSRADEGRVWRSRRTRWISFWTAAIRRRSLRRMVCSMS
jgi:hypothetical protein